jgi:NADH dehydrogenase [ubiquinone] 1 alpha subcomplex assembly factor 1
VQKRLFDVADPATAADWHPIEDRVMGGLSRSGLSGAMSCLIVARGDIKQYKLSLLTDDGLDSLS